MYLISLIFLITSWTSTFLMLFWKSKCVSQIFALTKGWLTLKTSSSETLYEGQFTTWYQQVLTKLAGECSKLVMVANLQLHLS